MHQRHISQFVIGFLMVAIMALAGCQPVAPTVQPAVAQPTPEAKPTALLQSIAAPSATPQPSATTQAARAEPVLSVGGKALTMQDLQALEQISTEVEGSQYKGIRVLDVLGAGDMTADVILLAASDGYSAGVEVATLTDQCLLAYNDKGGVDAVLPGLGRGQWVREVVEISVGAAKKEAPSAMNAGEIIDSAGQTLKLDKLPQRIVVVGRGPYMSLHLLYMFPEACERLVGMEKKGSSVSDFLPLVDPEFGNKQIIEQNPGPEQVAALKPDLVIMKGNMVDKLGQSLAQVGIPTLYVCWRRPSST